MKTCRNFPARRWLMLAMTIGAGAVSAYTEHRPLRKLVIIALAKDTALATQVESGLKKRFSERGTDAVSLRDLFPTPAPVARMTEQMRSQGYQSLLCVAPRKTIHWSAHTAAADPEMEDCLVAYATGVFPSGDPLAVKPFDEDSPATRGVQGLTRGPLPSHTGETPYVVHKGLIRLFDVATGKSVWQGFVEARMPDNLRSSARMPLIVHAIWQEIIKAGVFSPS